MTPVLASFQPEPLIFLGLEAFRTRVELLVGLLESVVFDVEGHTANGLDAISAEIANLAARFFSGLGIRC